MLGHKCCFKVNKFAKRLCRISPKDKEVFRDLGDGLTKVESQNILLDKDNILLIP
jgi:hypothetical protein